MIHRHSVLVIMAVICLTFWLPLAIGQDNATGKGKADKPRFDWEALQGTWAEMGYEMDGQEHLWDTPGYYWRFGQWDAKQWLPNSEQSDPNVLWRIDTGTKPKRFDLFRLDETRGEVLARRGVYELRGDTILLTHAVGFGFGGAGPRGKPIFDRDNKITWSERPKSLTTAPGDGFVKRILKRVTDGPELLPPEDRQKDARK